MMLYADQVTPLYKQLYQQLRDQIEDGTLEVQPSDGAQSD
jgi:DNA-binding GntR family transcriptional regulator